MRQSARRRLILSLCLLLASVLTWGCSSDVKIGAVISQSGSVATYGEHVKKGMDLAAEELNAAGGVNGGTLTLVYRDDTTNTNVGTQVTTELIEEEGVNAIIGTISIDFARYPYFSSKAARLKLYGTSSGSS